jgi:phage terminase large subunit-like protein
MTSATSTKLSSGRSRKRSDKIKAIQHLIANGELSQKQKVQIAYDWSIWARDSQLEPPLIMPNGQYWVTWLILAGRGWGKTRCGAEIVNSWAKSGKYGRIAIVATDAADGRDVMVEGSSGIMEVSNPYFKPVYEPSKKRLTWPNGAQAQIYSAEDPDSLRGPQFHAAWCDEICKWANPQDTWDNLQFGLRLGDNPRQVVTTTPRPIKLIKDIILRDDTFITKGSTYENLENLAPAFRSQIVSRYEGTRIGRQELEAELLEDTPGALWQRDVLDETRAVRKINGSVFYKGQEVEIIEIVVAVDPTTGANDDEEGKNDECGIIVVGKGRDGRGYVLADCSVYGSPDEWGKAVVKAFDDHKANWIIYEANQGGEMVASVLRACAKSLREQDERPSDHIPLKKISASRGKATRAEPVSALYEQKRISHVGTFPVLEQQQTEFTADFDKKKSGYSPDRVDALVWAFTATMVNTTAHEGLREFYRLQNGKIQNRLANAHVAEVSKSNVSLKAPDTVSRAIGLSGTSYSKDAEGRMLVKPDDVPALLRAGWAYSRESNNDLT